MREREGGMKGRREGLRERKKIRETGGASKRGREGGR